MYFVKPVNISSVTRCKILAGLALFLFWAFFFSFFLAPLWISAVLLVLHVLVVYLFVTALFKLLAYLVLSAAGEGTPPASLNKAAGVVPDPKNSEKFLDSSSPIT